MTNYSRSVLKSNGLRHSKNLPVKFGFSPKTVPANIAKKLPPQCCSKPLLIPFFNFSHKWPAFAFAGESGYTLGFPRKIAHNGTHAETGAFRTGPLSLPSERSARSRTSPGRVSERRTLPLWDLGREGLSKNAESLRGPAGLRDPVVRPLMLRFSVSVRKVSAQSLVNVTRSSSHLNPSTTQPSSKNRTQRLTRRNVCALDVAILEVSCYTDGHRKPLKNFLFFLKIV